MVLQRPIHPDAKKARREVTIFVPRDRVQEERDALVKLYQKRLKLPGYRKGHVPAEVVVEMLGEELEQEAFQKALKSLLKEELEALKLEPISRVKVEEKENDTTGQRVRLSFDVLPDFPLPDLSQISLEKRVPPVQEIEVEEVIRREAARHASLQEVDREIREGDAVRVDLIRKTPSGRRTLSRNQNVLLLMDEHQTPAVREALMGKRAGETVEVQGERSKFLIKIHAVMERTVPAIDDSLAKTLGYESLEALKDSIRDRLRAIHEEEAEDILEQELIETLYQQIEFELPQSMVADELDDLMERFREEYRMDEVPEDVKSELRRIAEHRVKRSIILSRTADHLGLEPTEEEIQREVERLAQDLGYKPANLLERLRRSEHWHEFLEGIRQRKAMDYLKRQIHIQIVLG